MKKILYLLMTLVTVMSAFSVAASEPAMSNFKASSTYTSSVYTDVSSAEWYNVSVKKCYELALMLGNGDGRFNPEGNVTLAEALTIASRVHNIYNGGNGILDTSVGQKWYDGIVTYATSNGIVKADDFTDFELAATRAEMAYIFSNALPGAEYNVINKNITAPDVKNTDKYSNEILALYKAGIVIGSDANHNFFPLTNIKRCEAAAIICRIVDKSERITVKDESSSTESGNSGNISDNTFDDEYFEDDYIDDEYIPGNDVSDTGLFDENDTESDLWNGVLDDSIGPAKKYTINKSAGYDRVYFTMKGSFGDAVLDMSKVRIGFATVDWTTEELSFIGHDVRLGGTYTKCESDNDLTAPGMYTLSEKKLEGVDCTLVKLNLDTVDFEKIRAIENFEKAGTNDVTLLVFAADSGWYTGFDSTFVIIDNLFKTIKINNYFSFDTIKYYIQNDISSDDGYLLLDDFITIPTDCYEITFETDNGTNTYEITEDILKNGLTL